MLDKIIYILIAFAVIALVFSVIISGTSGYFFLDFGKAIAPVILIALALWAVVFFFPKRRK